MVSDIISGGTGADLEEIEKFSQDSESFVGGRRRRRHSVKKHKRKGRKGSKKKGSKKKGSKRRGKKGGFDSGLLVPAALLGALQYAKSRKSRKSGKKSRKARRKRK